MLHADKFLSEHDTIDERDAELIRKAAKYERTEIANELHKYLLQEANSGRGYFSAKRLDKLFAQIYKGEPLI